jgi:hypothetical protein
LSETLTDPEQNKISLPPFRILSKRTIEQLTTQKLARQTFFPQKKFSPGDLSYPNAE